MAERLTWDEIKRKYPDEYVVIVDPEHDEATTTLLGGTVVNHGRNKQEMYRFLGGLNVKGGGCLWTGKVHGRIWAVSKREGQ